MKNRLLVVIFCFMSSLLLAQTWPSNITAKTLDGAAMSSSQMLKGKKLYYVTFWATWCAPCKQELEALREYNDTWRDSYNTQIIAISLDDQRTGAKIKPMLEAKGWPYTFYWDPNKDFATVFNITSIPFAILVDEKGKIIHQTTGYQKGDEDKIEQIIEEHINK